MGGFAVQGYERHAGVTTFVPDGATLAVDDPDFTLYCGDVRDVLPQLPAGSVDCVLTSPPYWGLRDYGADGQIGLEQTPAEYVEQMVAVFREVRRVLSDTGTLWLNLGDSYVSVGSSTQGVTGQMADRSVVKARAQVKDTKGVHDDVRRPPSVNGLVPKNLVGIPWQVAFALQADGWILRADIVWFKQNAMPESVTDRPTKAHEYVFLFSKQPRYFYDSDAIAEPAAWERWGDQTVPKYEGTATATGWIKPKSRWELRKETGEPSRRGFSQSFSAPVGDSNALTRNARSVWAIPTQPYSEAHFATWPEALCERIIKAGCPDGGTVLDPFMGSGTTALVARRLGHKAVGVELNEEYARLAAKRCAQQSLFA